MTTGTTHGPSYSRRAFDVTAVQRIVPWAVRLIADQKIEAIAATGQSGLVIAGAIGYAAEVPVIAVRKAGEIEYAHDDNALAAVLPNGPVRRWAFVDDLIETGRTFLHVRDTLTQNAVTLVEDPALILLYGSWNTNGTKRIDGREYHYSPFRYSA